MLLLPLFLAGRALAQGKPKTTHTVTVLDDNPDQRTLNHLSSLGPDETFTILTLKPSGTDEHSQTKWVETTGLSAETTVTSQLSFETTTSASKPSGTATHSISWQNGHHLEVVTVTGPDGKPSEVTRADLFSTHVTVSASTKDDGRTVLVPVDKTETTTITERLTKEIETATVTVINTRSAADDIDTATITTFMTGVSSTSLPHKEGAIGHWVSSSKCHANPFRRNQYNACVQANCMAAFQRPMNYSTMHEYQVSSTKVNITYATSVTTAHWGMTKGGKHIYTAGEKLPCNNEDACQQVCVREGKKAFKSFLVLAILIPLLIFLALLFCCCVPLLWCFKRSRNGRAYGSNKALTEGSETAATGGNSITRVSNDPVGSGTQQVVTGSGSGAAGSSAPGGGKEVVTTTQGGPAAGDSTATISEANGGRAGTMRRAAEEGRAPQRVRFDPNNGGETVTTTTAQQVDGAAELRTGSEVFDVGSMRGRKRNRGDEPV